MVNRKTKSSRFLRSCIFEALMILMEQKDYEDIAISEIASKAGVSRMTYYRTYSSKEDILIQYFKEKIEESLPSSPRTPVEYRQWLRLLMTEVAAHSSVIKLIEKNPRLTHTLLKFFVEETETLLYSQYGFDIDDVSNLYCIEYYCGGMAMIIHRWINSGMNETVDEMVDIIERCERINPASIMKGKANAASALENGNKKADES